MLVYISDFVVLKQRYKQPECDLFSAVVHQLSYDEVHPLHIAYLTQALTNASIIKSIGVKNAFESFDTWTLHWAKVLCFGKSAH